MVKNSAKKAQAAIAIYAIILFLYAAAFILIPFPKVVTSWISFGFTTLSIIASLIICGYAFKRNSATNAIYGFSIFKIGLIYMITQFTVGIILCTISVLIDIPYWISLVLSLLLLGIATIGVILTGNVRDVVVETEKNTEESIKTITIFNIDMSSIIDSCENQTLKVELQELGNTFKYSSDPVSSEATEEVEIKIKEELKLLKEMVVSSNFVAASEKAKMIGILLAERNRICQANK